MKTSELTGAALDWAVGLAEGITMNPLHRRSAWISYSTDWTYGGFIIERENINLRLHAGTDKQPIAFVWANHQPAHRQHGPTLLVAAMRCHVANKLGDEIRIPEGLE